MKDTLKKYIEKTNQESIRHRKFVSILCLLSLLVAGGVFWQLRIVGITMTDELVCTIPEHIHTAECPSEQRLICTLPEGEIPEANEDQAANEADETLTPELICDLEEHEHTADCYETETFLVCDDEHHSGECYDEEGELICAAEHEHNDSCYETAETLICGLEEHSHGDECYASSPEAEEVAEAVPHYHTDACYETVYTCGYEEHEHTSACYSDHSADLKDDADSEDDNDSKDEDDSKDENTEKPDADAKTDDDWEKGLPELSGEWAQDLVAVAQSQLGYHESVTNVEHDRLDDGTVSERGYTRYGDWYGQAYLDNWSAAFASFCLTYADIPAEAAPINSGCEAMLHAWQNCGIFADGEYIPRPGDLVFLDLNACGACEQIGIITQVDEAGGSFTAIAGNCDDAVQEMSLSLHDSAVIGYGDLTVAYENAVKIGLGGSQTPKPPQTVTHIEGCADECNDPACTCPCHEQKPPQAVTHIEDCSDECNDPACTCSCHEKKAEAPLTETVDLHGIIAPEASAVYQMPDLESPFLDLNDILASLTEDISINITEKLTCADGSIWYKYLPASDDGELNAQLAEYPYLPAEAVIIDVQPEEPEELTTVELADDFLYENDRFSIVLHVEGSAYLPAETSAAKFALRNDLPQNTLIEPVAGEATADDVTEENAPDESTVENEMPVLVVTELDEQQTEYQQIASAYDAECTDELLDLSVLSMEFYYQDTVLDVSSCNITARITPQTQMMETAQAAYAEMGSEAAPEAEAGVVFAVVEATEDGTEELDSTVVNASTKETPVLTASVGSNGILAVAATQTANPKFTVQYYAWLDIAADSGSDTDNLPIIDTSGGILPQNGITPTTKTLYLEETSAGSGVYGIKTDSILTRVYSSHDYQYITAPNLTYFNRLYENGHYIIKEIWVLKAGKNADSVNQADWNVYDPAQTHFTNRSQSENANTVLINDNTVIRLVFNTTESMYTNAVNFYDYDITNDGVHTAAQGINSASNYSGSGSKLAFGNNNTDTGLGDVDWNGNTLNKANSNGYSDCTFGLVTGVSDGIIQYAGGVDAPKMFNEGSAQGKTSYDSGQYSLAFARNGDTYTLSSVGGTNSATSLQTFTGRWNWNNTRKIWSNHFWPMDNVTNTDPHTGVPGNTGTYIGASGKTKSYPESDNGIAHNNMFGMTYQVQFTLTEDYAGPLEYYFFGDDDMWVFLDNQLVCDIGGVHSSVGEYVNLWDYVAQGSAGTHTLSFYYTERGLSGSTCYMQFTLPSVSSITPEQNTGLLMVQKLVEGAADSDEQFHFEIKFTDAAGNNLPDDYSYTQYKPDGTVVKQDIIIYDGGSFDLKAGEYIIINYLPYGTKYTITETDVPTCYKVTYQVDSGAPVEGYKAAGQIPQGGNGSVVYTNTVRPVLPETGGTGKGLYTGAGLLIMAAALYGYKLRRDRGRRLIK